MNIKVLQRFRSKEGLDLKQIIINKTKPKDVEIN